jgi:probable rRNA maturation factor
MKTAKVATRARVSRTTRSRRPSRALRLTLQNATTSGSVPAASQFRKWIRAALHADASITLRVVGLKEARELNRAYRGKNYATNVLTFVFRGDPPFEGDLALCAPVVTREARSQRKHVAAHYAHLTVHGILHLQGYDHDTEADAAQMEKLEARILKRLGYPNPYATPLHHG